MAAEATAPRTTVTGPSVWERWALLWATVAVVVAVAGIAGAISYGHMHDWASVNGEPAWRALLFPLSVDGLLIAASAVLLADSRAGRQADWLAYLLVVVGSAVSVTANVAHDWESRVAGIAIAGWPPLALVGSYELLMRLLRRLRLPAESDTTSDRAAGTAEGEAAETPPEPTTHVVRDSAPVKRPKTSRPRKAGPVKARASREPEARAWRDREVAEGRDPSGADVARFAGVDASLGRRWLREWIASETETVTATTGATGESRTGDQSATEMTDDAEATGRAA
jgi:hypothetical protein